MKKIIILSLFAAFMVSCVSEKEKSFHDKHPLAKFECKEVKAGNIKSKSLEHLQNYVKDELDAPEKKLIETMNKKYVDFGLPGKLPNDPVLLEFLSYIADHYRVAYLHLGKEPDRKNQAFLWKAGALRDLWIYHGDENARRKYVVVMQHAIRNIEKMSDDEIRGKIDESGLKNFWHPLMKSAASYYGSLYEATGNERYAKRACLLLERFGEVFDKWKLHYQRNARDKRGRGSFVLDKTVPRKYSRYGLWGYWGNVHDLTHSIPLIDAYTLVKGSETFRELPSENKKVIVDGLLHKIIKKHLFFPFQPLHNQSMNRIYGMIYFGKHLNSPEYIHIAVRWINEMVHLGYRRDGYWSEGTEAYGMGVTKGIFKAAKELKGWSDPKDYHDYIDDRRFDNFDPEKEFGYNFKMIKEAFNKLTLPDGRSIPLEDSTWNSKKFSFCEPPKIAKPFLFGASGVGMLGFGKNNDQTRLYFHWDDSAGHDHNDALGIALWAENQEICSETGYRGLHKWNISTAAHNTVMIDEKNQPRMNKEFARKKKEDIIYRYPHYKFGELWSGNRSRYDDLGKLRLWDVSEKNIQVAEVDCNRAFKKSDKIEKYQRTLTLVKAEGDNFYIVDIFRVKGGRKHDWMLHGNLGKKYDIKLFSENGKAMTLEKQKGKIGEFLENLKSVKNWNKNFAVEFDAKDGAIFKSIICAAPGTDIIVAEGPSIRLSSEPSSWGKPGFSSVKARHKENSKYLAVRRNGPENVFVAVHEAFKDKPCVEGVELLSAENPVRIKVKLKDREDVIESYDGKIKYSGNGKTVIFGGAPLSGNVIAVTSVDRGDKENSFTVFGDLQGKVKGGEVIIIVDGESRHHPYVIKKIVPLEGNKTKILTKGETGILLKGNLMIMTYFPSWDIAGKLTYKIPGKQITK
jgi:heparinase II/III-like protein